MKNYQKVCVENDQRLDTAIEEMNFHKNNSNLQVKKISEFEIEIIKLKKDMEVIILKESDYMSRLIIAETAGICLHNFFIFFIFVDFFC